MRGVWSASRAAAGFIGGHLVDALLSLGGVISVIDDLSSSVGLTRTALAQEATPSPSQETGQGAGQRLGEKAFGMHADDMMGGRLYGFYRGQSGQAAAAKALGITTDELQTALQDGKTLADLAEEKGVDLQTLRDTVEAAEKTARIEQIEQ